MPEPTIQPVTSGTWSFRDPLGTVAVRADRVIRLAESSCVGHLEAILASSVARRFISRGTLVRTRRLESPESDELLAASPRARFNSAVVFEHERIPFASYPYEWPSEMLHAAAELTVELAAAALEEGFGLKDGTPYNVLFRGPVPVFVDVLSLERRNPQDATWLPYGQFVRTFLLPLAVNKHLGWPLCEIFLARRDGLEPEEVYARLPLGWKLRPPFLALASVPAWLAQRHDPENATIYAPRLYSDPEKAEFILRALFRRLACNLGALRPACGHKSTWSEYERTSSYSAAQSDFKAAVVRQAVAEAGAQKVLDIGANTGRYSEVAAACGCSVVAIDRDPVVIGTLWRRATQQRADILPLVVDISRPSGGLGWRNCECPPFLERAAGAFDSVLMLAVLHHLLVTERVPLVEIIDLASVLTNNLLIIEFIPREDPMFRRLSRGRDALHAGLTLEAFEAALTQSFAIHQRHAIPGSSRVVYVAHKRGA